MEAKTGKHVNGQERVPVPPNGWSNLTTAKANAPGTSERDT